MDKVVSEERSFYSYWGKAFPGRLASANPYHLLVYHSLDVAAVGHFLLDLPVFSLRDFARELGWTEHQVKTLATFFLAVHDIGKFARAFQGLAPGLSDALVPAVSSKHYDHKHDTLGWVLWRCRLSACLSEDVLPHAEDGFWSDWMRACVGHHGRPPLETHKSGLFPLEVEPYFCADDIDAAQAFVTDLAAWLLPGDIPVPTRKQRDAIKRYGWRLAGLAVLADWLGSDQSAFSYCAQPGIPLAEYWNRILPVAQRVVLRAGLDHAAVRNHDQPFELFDYLREPTPLQQLAAGMDLVRGPQLFMLEDVTGAGKTEAAMILAYRLMRSGDACGLYFGLPTMATANQMYQRLGSVYRKLYETDAMPSLVLAHGARRLVEGFRQSVVRTGEFSVGDYSTGEPGADTQCSAWLADNNKKALLAQVGVGTLDQALLGVLPVRHQSLRLLGLSGKVLVADEVHAYDPYMITLLKGALRMHASLGGSAILLSATLPAVMRRELARAFMDGRGSPQADRIGPDARYPLVTHVHAQASVHPCATRESVKRIVSLHWLHEVDAVSAFVREQAAQGRSVCWIRNTVDDARQAYAVLKDAPEAQRVSLFHSRYAMGDRLDIEDDVLRRFGKCSTQQERAGQVLVATQVVEQSLDLDFDVLISDLAPIDLLIQRAGRLHRHVRDAQGNPAAVEERAAPVLHVLGPLPSAEPAADWYAALFPKGQYVYPDVAKLWVTQQVLLEAGAIVSPGEPGEAAGVRALVEAVYGEQTPAVPDALMAATIKHEGEVLADISHGGFNLLKMDVGYCQRSSDHWHEDTNVPTRLGEDTAVVYLARAEGEDVRPWREAEVFAWEQSSVRIPARHGLAPAPEWAERFGHALRGLRADNAVLGDESLIVPLADIGKGEAEALMEGRSGRRLRLRYSKEVGLSLLETDGLVGTKKNEEKGGDESAE